MEFGFEKCAMVVLKAGVRVESKGIELPSGDKIKELEGSGYKYLGVLQECGILHKEMKEKIGNEYMSRVKAVAKSFLYSKNLFTAINVWAVSVVRYSAGIVDWTDKEMKDLDIKTRNILTMNGIFHKKGNVNRLYLPRGLGGRGLISVESCVKLESLNLRNYLFDSTEPLLRAANQILYPKDVELKEKIVVEEEDYWDGIEQTRLETGKEFKEQEVSEKASEVFNKPMHGEWFRNVGEDTSERTFDWLKKGYLDKRTEGYIFSAQEQALQTNWLKSRITGGEVDRMCRKCKQYPEKVSHIVSGCSKLASSAYRKRHDRMGLRVYWEICKNYGIKCSEKWYQETPDSVRISNCGKFEIWWDRKVETPKPLEANRPDVVLIDQEKKHWTMIDFSVPNDANVEKKEQEKIEKYTPLAHEIRKMNHVSVKTVPLVVGALGVVSNNLEKGLQELGIGYAQTCMQKTAIIGTTTILKKFLSS